MEAERPFSHERQIRNWLHTSMSTDRLGDLAVIAIHEQTILVSKSDIYKTYMSIHPHRMIANSRFIDA